MLLVIFIITTTPIVNDLDLNLPSAARRDKEPPAKANYVTVTGNGSIFLNKQETDFANLHAQLVELRTADPDLSVIVRGDAKTRYERIVDILDLLQQANVLKVNLATEPLPPGER